MRSSKINKPANPEQVFLYSTKERQTLMIMTLKAPQRACHPFNVIQQPLFPSEATQLMLFQEARGRFTEPLLSIKTPAATFKKTHHLPIAIQLLLFSPTIRQLAFVECDSLIGAFSR